MSTFLTRRTSQTIIETARLLIDRGDWRFPTAALEHKLSVAEMNLADSDDTTIWWNLVLSRQANLIASDAQAAFHSGDLDLAYPGCGCLLDPTGFEDDARTSPAVALAA